MSETTRTDANTTTGTTNLKGYDGRDTRPDYVNRKRNLEWRHPWFQLVRPRDDQQLLDGCLAAWPAPQARD